MLNVPIINNNIAQCFVPVCIENVISMYCKYRGIEYETIFLKGYNFHFDRKLCNNGRIADGLYVNYDCTLYLEELYGIKTQKKILKNFTELINFIKREMERYIPCIIHMDSYYLKWSNFFKKEHTEHLIIVVGIDMNSKTVDVIDSIDSSKVEILSFQNLFYGCKFYLFLSVPKIIRTLNQKQIEEDIIRGVFNVINENRFQEMEDFATCFLDFFSADIEFRNKNDINLMSTEKLVDEIRKYIKGINLFVIWLTWRDEDEKKQRFSEIIIIYRQIMSRWSRIINTLLKNSITIWEENFGHKAYDEILEIINLEKNAYENFLKCLKCGNIIIKGVISNHVNDDKKTVFMDLIPFMNNSGFANHIVSEGKDLTGAGEYFVFDKIIQGISYYNKIPYYIKNNQVFDNVICSGQILDVNIIKKVLHIGIVCCAEWGSSVERLEIIKKSDESIFIPFFIKDISECNEENACIFGKTYGNDGRIICNKAAVFMEVLNVGTEIVKIILPKAANVHILSITFITT